MIKLTPGEWIVKELLSSWGVFAVNEGERTGVADCLEYADARLIAAAPEMYRLLQNFCYPEEPFDARMAKKCDEVWELLKRIDGEEVITNG